MGMMKARETILTYLDGLIEEGKRLAPDYPAVSAAATTRWIPRIRTLKALLGSRLAPWEDILDLEEIGHVYELELFLGALNAIREAVELNLLTGIEDMVLAEAMHDLLEQADYLIEKGYGLAAGVLGRAVLEEHLRKSCDRKGCLPTGRPTINDLNQALYKDKHLDKVAMKQVEALAVTGNHCAHNDDPPLEKARLETFLRHVREFLTRHPLS